MKAPLSLTLCLRVCACIIRCSLATVKCRAQSCSSSDISIAWSDTFDSGNRNDIAYDVAAIDDDNDGQKDDGFAIVGTTDFVDSPKTQGFIIRLDETGAELWRHVTGGTGNDAFNSVIQASNGKIIVCGWTKSNAVGTGSSPNVWVLEYNVTGGTPSEHHYGGSGTDQGWDIIEDEINSVYVVAGRAGYVATPDGDLQNHGSINAQSEYWVLTLDASAFTIGWEEIYHGSYTGGTGDGWATSIMIDNGGNYQVSGFCASCDPLKVQWDALMLNLDPSDGSVNWSGVYGYNLGFGSRDQVTYQVIEATENGDDFFIAAGVHHPSQHANCFGNYQHDVYGLKIDDAGNDIWTPGCELSEGKNYGGTYIDNAYGVVSVCDGDYLLAGNSKSPTANYDITCNNDANSPYTSDAWLLKLNSYGGVAWDASLGDVLDDEFHSIKQVDDGSFVVAGEFGTGANYDLQNFYVVKFELANCPAPTNLTATGASNCKITFDWDASICAQTYLLRYRKVGTSSWTNQTTTASTFTTPNPVPAGDYEWNVRAKCSPNVTSSLATASSNVTACRIGFESTDSDNQVLSVYPNPSAGVFNISLILTSEISEFTRVDIVDIVGNLVASLPISLVNGIVVQQLFINLPSGFYSLKMKVSGRNYQVKLFIQRP